MRLICINCRDEQSNDNKKKTATLHFYRYNFVISENKSNKLYIGEISSGAVKITLDSCSKQARVCIELS